MKKTLFNKKEITGEKIADSLLLEYDDGSDGELLEAIENGDIPEDCKIDVSEVLFNE